MAENSLKVRVTAKSWRDLFQLGVGALAEMAAALHRIADALEDRESEGDKG